MMMMLATSGPRRHWRTEHSRHVLLTCCFGIRLHAASRREVGTLTAPGLFTLAGRLVPGPNSTLHSSPAPGWTTGGLASRFRAVDGWEGTGSQVVPDCAGPRDRGVSRGPSLVQWSLAGWRCALGRYLATCRRGGFTGYGPQGTHVRAKAPDLDRRRLPAAAWGCYSSALPLPPLAGHSPGHWRAGTASPNLPLPRRPPPVHRERATTSPT